MEEITYREEGVVGPEIEAIRWEPEGKEIYVWNTGETKKLFDLGAELCQPGKHIMRDAHEEYLNLQAKKMNADLPPLKEFILPGGAHQLGHLHVARTVCRRAERSLVALHEQQPVNPLALAYLNRLSDLLFILPRFVAQQNGLDEIYWQSEFSRG